MPQKKAKVSEIWDPQARKRLENLYARRSTIDSLIRSLEEYDRYRPKDEADDVRGSGQPSESRRYFERSV